MSTEIVVILDRSGSMAHGQDDMQGGLDAFMRDQKSVDEPGATLTFARFDGEYELIHDAMPLNEAPRLVLEPRGSTALLDAVGKTLATVRGRPRGTEDKVVVMIVTDGHENASHEWTREGVKTLVDELRGVDWQILFLGADVDAFTSSQGMGIQGASTMSFDKGKAGAMFVNTTTNVRAYREGTRRDTSYTSEQREEVK